MTKNHIGIIATVAVLAVIFIFHGKYPAPDLAPAPAPVVIATPTPAPVVPPPSVVQPKHHITPAPDQGTAEQRAACMPDAYRLCSSAIPDRDKIIACMAANKSQLSPTCRAMFAVPVAAAQSKSSVHRKPKPHARVKSKAPEATQ